MRAQMLRRLGVWVLLAAFGMMFCACAGNGADLGQEKPGKEETDMTSLIDSMTQSPFRDDSLNTQELGLTAPENVGVDRERFETEIRYPVAEDAAFSSDAIFSVKKEEGTEGLLRILEAARECNRRGKQVKIKLPAGEFRLSMSGVTAGETYLLQVQGFDGLHIEGSGTTLVMENDGSQWLGFFEFSDCKNVYMQDVALDYAVAPVLAGTLTSLDTQKMEAEVALEEEFLDTWGEYGEVKLKSYVEVGSNNAPYPDGNFYYDSGDAQGITSCVFKEGTAKIRFNGTLNKTPLGTKVSLALTMYGNNAIHFEGCENMHLETVRVYTCPGMGITAMKCNGLYWNRANVMLKEGSARLMTATADAMHLTSCTGDVIISNCLIENTHDDGINIKAGFYMSVNSVSYSSGKVVLDGYSDENLPLKEGDQIEIYTDKLEYVTTLTATSVQSSGRNYAIFPSEDIFDVTEGMYAVNISVSPDFVYENNIIRNKRNRGMLIQVRGAVIRNCTFSNIAHGSINVISELATGAREAMMPRDILFENCKFLSDSSVYAMPFANIIYAKDWSITPNVIRGVDIKNCFLTAASRTAILFYSGTDCEIRNNFFYSGGEESFIAVDLKKNTGNVIADNCSDVASVWKGSSENTATGNRNIAREKGAKG